MDELRLIALLRLKSGEVPERSRFCPDDGTITAYFEGSLGDRACAGFRHHAAGCRHCQARIGNLARLESAEEGQQVPGGALAEAKGLAAAGSTRGDRVAWAGYAAAAMLLMISTVLWVGPKLGQDTQPVTRDAFETPRVLRSTPASVLRPDILSPVDGEHIKPGKLSVRWTPVSGSLHYDVWIVDEDGFVVRSGRVEGITEWTAPVSHLIEPGRTYYVRVDAYLPGANTVTSDHVLFTVENRR